MMQSSMIGPHNYITWTFTFGGDAVKAPFADLSFLSCASDLEYEYFNS